jgi:hypothetical protein
MADSELPVLLHQPTYLARVTRRDGPAIEEAMAGATLLSNGARLDGAFIEAAYAYDRPPLLKRLHDDGVPRIVDLQTLRFAGPRYLEIAALSRRPYAPEVPITVDSFTDAAADALARDGLSYAQDRGTDLYLAPTVPLFDRHLERWLKHGDRLLRAAVAHNGAGEIERKPRMAPVAPGARALQRPELLTAKLLDHPVDAVYVWARQKHMTLRPSTVRSPRRNVSVAATAMARDRRTASICRLSRRHCPPPSHAASFRTRRFVAASRAASDVVVFGLSTSSQSAPATTTCTSGEPKSMR